MRKTLYRYNEETCQYERIKVKTPDVVFYISGVLVSAILILAAMLVLHDFFIDSEKEISLRKENNALSKNRAVLASHLDEIDASLEKLSEKDQALHLKFFGTPLEKVVIAARGLAARQILLADASAFRSTISQIEEKSGGLLHQSGITTSYFHEKLSMDLKDAARIYAMPTLPPIAGLTADKLVSGFGMRINPFHKGMYEHPGIDIAATRGTEVLATAMGTIVDLKRSELQAGYGNFIDVDHGHGFVTRYAHLESINVRLGQRIKKGTVIGTIGSSGGSVAPHLHYEILRKGKPMDPVHFMIEGVTSEDYEVLKSTSQKQNQSLD
jgi:murein DD-endopeptidase MepM/ murein hydrolase activator NlpD